jgi:hypothetical protein
MLESCGGWLGCPGGLLTWAGGPLLVSSWAAACNVPQCLEEDSAALSPDNIQGLQGAVPRAYQHRGCTQHKPFWQEGPVISSLIYVMRLALHGECLSDRCTSADRARTCTCVYQVRTSCVLPGLKHLGQPACWSQTRRGCIRHLQSSPDCKRVTRLQRGHSTAKESLDRKKCHPNAKRSTVTGLQKRRREKLGSLKAQGK